MTDPLLCSDCFSDQGLKLNALQIGVETDAKCVNCGSTAGAKLNKQLIEHLAQRFFVRGTIHRLEFGAAPLIQFNKLQQTSIAMQPWTDADLRLFEKTLGVGFFRYGPRMWMMGQVEPLEALQRPGDNSVQETEQRS